MVWSKNRCASAAVLGLLCVGVALRLHLYFVNRSLSVDEAALALNIVNRSFSDLLKPLDINQGAPVAFLLLVKATVAIFGNKDFILRIVPLVSGLLSVPLMYFVGRQCGGRLVAIFSLAIFAVSPALTHFSTELKQYSTDVFVALLLLWLGDKCFEQPRKLKAYLSLGLGGAIAIWVSHPSLFVLGGLFMTLAIEVLIVQRNRQELASLMGAGTLNALSLVTLYYVNLRFLESNRYLIDYWAGYFAPMPPWSHFRWYYDAIWSLLNYPAAFPTSIVTVSLLLLGAISLLVRRWFWLSAFAGTLALTIVASALGKYPFNGRLLLFLMPILISLVAEGISRLRISLSSYAPRLAGLSVACCAAYLLNGPIATVYGHLNDPSMGEHIKPVMSYLRLKSRPGDIFYVYYGARNTFAYYAPQFGVSQKQVVNGVEARTDPKQYLEDLQKLKGVTRVWVVFSHNCDSCLVNEQQFILQQLDRMKQRSDEFHSSNADVYLYDLT